MSTTTFALPTLAPVESAKALVPIEPRPVRGGNLERIIDLRKTLADRFEVIRDGKGYLHRGAAMRFSEWYRNNSWWVIAVGAGVIAAIAGTLGSPSSELQAVVPASVLAGVGAHHLAANAGSLEGYCRQSNKVTLADLRPTLDDFDRADGIGKAVLGHSLAHWRKTMHEAEALTPEAKAALDRVDNARHDIPVDTREVAEKLAKLHVLISKSSTLSDSTAGDLVHLIERAPATVRRELTEAALVLVARHVTKQSYRASHALHGLKTGVSQG